MIEIDGSHGEGGGQIVRSCLALSLVTGQPVRIEKIRAGRSRPGLMRQHLVGVRAAQRVGRARVEGAELHSSRLVFQPQRIQPGRYRFRIGTAGSTTLVAQTVLPALLTADGPSELLLEGGTHNHGAPPYDFLVHAYLRQLRRLGHEFDCRLKRTGFYPAGGGEFTLRIEPAREAWPQLVLDQPLTQVRRRARILIANLPRHVADREHETLRRLANGDPGDLIVERVESRGPGNVVMIEIDSADVCEVVTSFGRRGLPAEEVATDAFRQAERYVADGFPVSEHLADQLLLPLSLSADRGFGGGRFLTGPLSGHAATHIEIIERFLGVRIRVREQDGGGLVVVR